MPGVPQRDVRPDPLGPDETAQWKERLQAILANAPDRDAAEAVADAVHTLLKVHSPTVDEVLRSQILADRHRDTWPDAAALLTDIARRRNGELSGCPPWLV